MTTPMATMGDVVAGVVAAVTYSGFLQKELEVGLLSEFAAACSIIYFAARFIYWLVSVLKKPRPKCRCGK